MILPVLIVSRNENLEVISCTDVTQKWGKEKEGLKETYKVEPFKNFCHPLAKKHKISFNSSKELDDANFALLSSGNQYIFLKLILMVNSMVRFFN